MNFYERKFNMKQNIGFIGCGNMAKALINGMIQTDSVNPENIIVSNPSMPKLNEVREKFNINITQNNITVAENSDVVFLSVKPNKYTQVIEEIRNYNQRSDNTNLFLNPVSFRRVGSYIQHPLPR